MSRLGEKILEMLQRECPEAFDATKPEAQAEAMIALADNLGGFFALINRGQGYATAMATVKIMVARMASFADGAEKRAQAFPPSTRTAQ